MYMSTRRLRLGETEHRELENRVDPFLLMWRRRSDDRLEFIIVGKQGVFLWHAANWFE